MPASPVVPSSDALMVRQPAWWQSSSASDDLAALLRIVRNASTIAVVGASGNLLHRGHGARIDAHDVVVRVNLSPAASGSVYLKDVGQRTTIRVITQPAWQSVRDPRAVIQPQETLVWTMTHLDDESGPPEWLRWNSFFASLVASGHVLAMNTSFSRQLSHETLDPIARDHWGVGRFMPSTGFQAIGLALAVARLLADQQSAAPGAVSGRSPRSPPTVSVFGFGACVPCNRYFSCYSDGQLGGPEAAGGNGCARLHTMPRTRTRWRHN